MAALLASIKGKVLIQIGDAEPVEVGTVEIPIHASMERPKVTRGREPARVDVNGLHDPLACPNGRSTAACLLDCNAPAHKATEG